jgi:thiosulfate dehydrogenase [quinone] large subunit
MSIGWHFFYEGVVKVINPKWTSLAYLSDSQGWFSEPFRAIASNQNLLDTVNIINEWGLILVGFGLIAGCFTRFAIAGAIGMLTLYYLSHPPFVGSEYILPREGSYLWIDKNLVEIAALTVLYVFPTWHVFGLDRYIFNRSRRRLDGGNCSTNN